MIETTINIDNIPENAGRFYEGPHGKHLHIKDIHAFKAWVLKQVNTDPAKTSITVTGRMSNCIALLIGTWISGRGKKIYYKTAMGVKWELV